MTESINRSVARAASALAVALCFAAPVCVARADDTTPVARVADRVFADATDPIVVRAGQLFLVSLDANPSTGYHWDAVKDPDPAVVMLRGTAFLTTSGLVGAPEKELRVYEATGSGSTTIALAYLPPGRGTKPAKEVTFKVTSTPADAR
jgi:predicted secreted protein